MLEYEGLSFENIEKEKLSDSFSYLAKSEKVILTPHIAGWTKESKYRIAMIVADKIRMLGV